MNDAYTPRINYLQNMTTTIEQDIKDAGVDKFPRITPARIEFCIQCEYYFTAGDAVSYQMGPVTGYKYPGALDLLTLCVLVLNNGFTVTGESACASPENFNAEIGKKIARQNAVQKIWMLEGYLLKEKLYLNSEL